MATWGKLVMSTLGIFLLFMAHSSFVDTLQYDKLNSNNLNQLSMRQDASVLQGGRLSKRSIARRVRRSNAEGDALCQSQEDTFLAKLKQDTNHEFLRVHEFLNETKFSLSLAWAGENAGKILVVTTEEIFILVQKSDIYQSTDDGKSFTNINAKINGAQIHKDNGLQKHPFMSEHVFVIAYSSSSVSQNSELYLTRNGGDTFEHVPLPFVFEEAFVFHPSRENYNYIMARGRLNAELFVSIDGGLSWKKINSHVSTYKWSTTKTDPAGTIYVTTAPNFDLNDFFSLVTQEVFDLYKSTDLGETWHKVHDEVITFGIQGDFLYTSVKKKDNSGERLMEVSKSGGKLWNEVQLPSITPDQFYSILDMSEGLVFMHVDNPKDSGHGTLYTSDNTGIIFSQSLERHLYPNFQDLTDFYKVKSMRGVYIASQMNQDRSIHTMISYDRGGEWRPITRPAGVPCKDESKETHSSPVMAGYMSSTVKPVWSDHTSGWSLWTGGRCSQACYLQIHNMYSVSRQIPAQPPLSTENAVGLILVHGHIADSLQTTPADVYVSSDGAYSWYKALDGPHHYQIADHGGLLVAVPADSTTVDTVKFSTDEGRCWHNYKFTNKSILFTGLLTEPGNRAMSVSIWGFGSDDHVWRTHVINFTKVIDRQCDTESDYEDFVPHSDNSNDGCLLGVKETFQRLRKDSWCSNGYSYERTSNKKICVCTKADYECDYGYYREQGQEACVEDPRAVGNELDICMRGHEEEIITKGYRKIPGDQCNGGFTPAGEKIVDLHKKCAEGDKSLDGEFTESGAQQDWSNRLPRFSRSGMILMSVVLLILLLTLIMLVYFVRKCRQLRSTNPSYRYTMLQGGDHNDHEIEDALGTGTSLYEEGSDEERENEHKGLVNGSAGHSNGALLSGLPNLSFSPRRAAPALSPTKPVPKVKSYHDDSDVDMLE